MPGKMQRRLEKNTSENGLSSGMNESILSDESDQEHENTKSSVSGVAINETGYCALCGRNSVCKCERCGDFYCSPQCQRRDWPNHRFICFPMPRLVKAVQNNFAANPPILKVDAKPTEIIKEENRQAYKARQLNYIPSPIQLPPNGSVVVLTGFKSSNRCFIRSADKVLKEEYLKTLMKIDKFGKNASEMTGIPKANTFAVALMNEKWCRVQILSARSENRVRVHFIDFGIGSVVFLRDLRRITGVISSLPCYVNMVQLHDVVMFSMEAKILEQLSHLTNKEFLLQIVDPDDKGGNVQLYHIGTNISLNSEIKKICQESCGNENAPSSNTSTLSNENADTEIKAIVRGTKEISSENGVAVKQSSEKNVSKCNNVSSAPENAKQLNPLKNDSLPPSNISEERHLTPPFKMLQFDTQSKDFRIIVVDTSYVSRGYIACILESECDNFKAVIKFLNNNDPGQEPYVPKLKEYCIAQFESAWYRAKVIDILDKDKFLVSYIDFGNESELSSSYIRRYPMSLTLPCSTNICALKGMPDDFTEELIEYLDRELGGFKRMTVDSVKMEDGIMFIECKQLLKELHERKFFNYL